jgi:hypothetical protein
MLPVTPALAFTPVTPAAVCTLASGNLKPPEILSTVPATVSGEVGAEVPMPTPVVETVILAALPIIL